MATAAAVSASAAAAIGGDHHRRHPLPWLNQMVTEPFYLLHLLAFFSYFAARSSVPSDLSHRLLRREIQAVLTFFVLISVKMVKEETWEAFIADALFYGKGLLLAVTLSIDYHLSLYYFVAFLVIWVVSQQPPYEGLGYVSHLTPLQLESLLIEGTSTRFWLVEFRASCSSACVRTSRIFPDLSTIYSNKKISFGIIDLGHFPNVAEKFGISLCGQLPTYILFDKATEVARFPKITSEARVFAPTITKKLLCQHFELDRRLIEYISS
ncbi:thioredoxin-related transmembrane protein 2 [Ananas comosus]|uniref:Thioredoxin-related transmembrane protein 2 n=1 Tax=Ananas comosus TaxID=4615 RepID=A0A6P5G2S0_ANACO|nr:thioredoxin-related transmembrane protein 2 [Ananas comosus]